MKKNDIFRFKQFEITHRVNAQKVSTDSVLLGAWANIIDDEKILDIGTGTGILSLMCAQRNSSVEITAIEIEKAFGEEAAINFSQSNYSNRIKLIIGDIKYFKGNNFDHIICNPPYFSNALKSDDSLKNSARHDLNLNFETLSLLGFSLLNEKGRISIVIPAEIQNSVVLKFERNSLHLKRICKVKHTFEMKPSLVLLEFRKNETYELLVEELLIKSQAEYSEEYKKMLKDFLTIF